MTSILNRHLVVFMALILGIPAICQGQNKTKHFILVENLRVDFECIDHMLEGFFEVRDASNANHLLISGQMSQGYKTGVWTVFDKEQQNLIVLQRNYSHPLAFTQTIPKPSENELVQFVQAHMYDEAVLDSLGGQILAFVSIQDFIYSERFWRSLTKTENPLFFSPEFLMKMGESKKELRTFKDDSFKELMILNPLDSLNREIVAYHLKEDFFFDKNRMVSEYRIIGLAPVFLDDDGKEQELCWYYFPDLRSISKTVHLEKGSESNLDDLFINRAFSASIYKTNGIKREEPFYEEVHCNLVDINYWLHFSGNTPLWTEKN